MSSREETRKALLDSARNLFEQDGYAETSVQAITDSAKLTKGAFYYHFESKEDLLRLIHDEFIEQLLAATSKVLANIDDPAEQLRCLIREMINAVDQFKSHISVFLQERRYLTGERFAAVKEKRDQLDRQFYDVILRGIDSGQFRSDLDGCVTALGIIGMCAWAYQWYGHGRLSADEVADSFSGLVLHGLCAGPRPAT